MTFGIFDSGLGGLTAVRELERLAPSANYIYFGDTARIPYGTRSIDIIGKYAIQDCRFLVSMGVDIILAACCTVSSNSLVLLQSSFNGLPVHGVVAPAVARAAETAHNGNRCVAVLGTGATIKSGAFETTLKHIDPGLKVISKACPLFVPLIENGYIDRYNPISRLVAEEYLEDIIPHRPDAVILGCTHYPLLAPLLSDLLPGSRLISCGSEAVISLLDVYPASGVGRHEFYVSDDIPSFCSMASTFIGRDISENVKKICIDAY